MDMDTIGPMACIVGVAWFFLKGLPKFFKFVDEEDERVNHRKDARAIYEPRQQYRVKRRIR